MKRRAVFLCAALAVMLYANSALASTVCQNLKGTWTFNYGGSDNKTVYINSVNDFDTNGGLKNSVFTCWAYALRDDGQQILIAGAINPTEYPYAPTTLGYYETYTPNASTPYDRINLTTFTGSFFENITKPLESGNGNGICSFYSGGTGTCYWLNSGLTKGRRTSTDALQPGSCKDWVGRWTNTYFNIATPADPNDNMTDNMTLTSFDNSTINNPALGDLDCTVLGYRESDNASITIAKAVGENYYRYYYTDNLTLVGNFDPFSQIDNSSFFKTQFSVNPSTVSQTDNLTNLISGKRITTTTTAPPSAGGTCKDWIGTWTLTYDSSTDTLPGDALGNGRNGDYEVKICKITENYVFPSAPGMTFPCFAEGTRPVDGKLIYFIASPFDPVTAYRTYYYELDSYPSGALSNGAAIAPDKFTGTAFTPSANTFGLTKGIRTDNTTTGCETPLECVLKIAPKKIFPLLTFISPIVPFVISAAKDSGIEFTRPIDIDWGTTAINDIIKIRIGKRIIFGLMIRRPLQLESDNYTVTVKYGDNDTEQCGTIEVK